MAAVGRPVGAGGDLHADDGRGGHHPGPVPGAAGGLHRARAVALGGNRGARLGGAGVPLRPGERCGEVDEADGLGAVRGGARSVGFERFPAGRRAAGRVGAGGVRAAGAGAVLAAGVGGPDRHLRAADDRSERGDRLGRSAGPGVHRVLRHRRVQRGVLDGRAAGPAAGGAEQLPGDTDRGGHLSGGGCAAGRAGAAVAR